MKKGFIIGFLSAAILLVVMIFSHNGASFRAYAPKLLKFEGKGYGIHQPIWGYRKFTKDEALNIHKHHYWNRYHGDLFDDQAVAEVLIDHLINAGDGKTNQNIKAFEKIIGAEPNGVISEQDVQLANDIEDHNWLVNQYVDYRVAYYKSLKNKKYQAGWLKRAEAFRVFENKDEIFSFEPAEEIQADQIEETAIVLNPKKTVKINGINIKSSSKPYEEVPKQQTISTEETDIIEDLN